MAAGRALKAETKDLQEKLRERDDQVQKLTERNTALLGRIHRLYKLADQKIAEINDKTAKVERMTEEGYDVVEIPLPCLFTVVKEINTPRMPSLKGMMRAKSAKIAKWTAADLDADPAALGLDGSPTRVVKIFTPEARKGGEMISGTCDEVAKELVELLKGEVV